MTTTPDRQKSPYTCAEYREEMILAALHRSLENALLTTEERNQIKKEIIQLEKKIGL